MLVAKRIGVLGGCSVMLILAGVVGTDAAPIIARSSGVQTANMDRTVRPADDLFAYANGTWLRDVAIPPDRSRYGVDTIMLENSLRQQRDLLLAAAQSADADERKAAMLYASYMEEASLERAGMAALDAELKRVAAIDSLKDVSAAFGRFAKIGVSVPVEAYVQPDAKDPTRYALWLTQSGLGLPDRDYYLSGDAHFSELRDKYRRHIAALLGLAGDAAADANAESILAFETQIAGLQWAAVDRRDPTKTYNPRTLDEMHAAAPALNWNLLLAETGIRTGASRLIARQPNYLAGLSQRLTTTPLPTIKAYLKFRLISEYAQFLPQRFADEDFSFSEGILHGTPNPPARWKKGCSLVDRLMGDALGKLYVRRYFPERAKAHIDRLVSNLLTAYADSLEHLDWMSSATRGQALLKLRKIRVRIGYPAHWRSYAKLEIRAGDLAGNVLRAREFESERQFAKLGRPVDRDEWDMTAPTVDAGYNPSTNSMEFPAGVLQPPLYDPEADDAYNYGSTGATIGHEISHAFDNRGSRYDGNGALHDWWTARDHAAFEAKTDQLVAQFDKYEPVKGFHVNGKLTLPENIADLAGLEIAYRTYITSLHGRDASVIDGFTGPQRFFIGYAQSFMGKRRDESLMAQLASNPHAPEKDRVNGIVAHMSEFYAVFDVQPGDKMYMPPKERVELW